MLGTPSAGRAGTSPGLWAGSRDCAPGADGQVFDPLLELPELGRALVGPEDAQGGNHRATCKQDDVVTTKTRRKVLGEKDRLRSPARDMDELFGDISWHVSHVELIEERQDRERR